MKCLLICIAMTLLLPACTTIVSRSEDAAPTPILDIEPAGTPVDAPVPGATKVVEMATQTPVSAAPTYTPYVPKSNSSPTPFTEDNRDKPLSEWGLPYETYRDTTAGLEFDYPSGWTVIDLTEEQKKGSIAYSISLRSSMPTVGPKQMDGIAPGVVAVDVTIFNDGSKTLEQAIIERRAGLQQSEGGQPPVIVQEEEWTLSTGIPSHRFLVNLGPAVLNEPGPDRMLSELVTIIKGRMVVINGQGDMSLFRGIALSLREIQ